MMNHAVITKVFILNFVDENHWLWIFFTKFLRTFSYLYDLKVHKHDIFFTFFAETETFWSQGPVTRDFWQSYSIRPRYSTFKHFRACSACDELGSQYAQHAMKLVPRMLSVRWNSFRVCSAWIVHVKIRSSYYQHAMKSVPCMLSMR